LIFAKYIGPKLLTRFGITSCPYRSPWSLPANLIKLLNGSMARERSLQRKN